MAEITLTIRFGVSCDEGEIGDVVDALVSEMERAVPSVIPVPGDESEAWFVDSFSITFPISEQTNA